MPQKRLIESDDFPFEFLSAIAKRESWRKEVHRPVYHVHKWWAKRLGSLFRGLALGSLLEEGEDLVKAFYEPSDGRGLVVFDPFLGSGTTVGESHKLGLTALGRDINPVAVEAVRVALGQLDDGVLQESLVKLDRSVGKKIRALYETTDSRGMPARVLYFFWVMQASCPACRSDIDLFNRWVRARNAYPRRKPEVQVVCPSCGHWFAGLYTDTDAECPMCSHSFDQTSGPVRGSKATCGECEETFSVRESASSGGQEVPRFRLYGKLVLTKDGRKEYLAATDDDQEAYLSCVRTLDEELESGAIRLPVLQLAAGHNTRQAMSYGFRRWRDFFNARQLLALGWLHEAIAELPPEEGRDALLTLFSGLLEFNNMFASYKGEGTGAVRHMFSHHILKPERTPIEANVWGTSKSSGSFSGLFQGRLRKAIAYRAAPTELREADSGSNKVICSQPFTGVVQEEWPLDGNYDPRGIYLSCGDSASTGLRSRSVDLVLTDPPFFDNVHYSELADFFYAWQQLAPRGFVHGQKSTRADGEVQDTDPSRFAEKLGSVFLECNRVLKDEGLLVFTYHHSREEGWTSLARAILESGFVVVNSQPLKAEMSVAAPKKQAKEPIQLDIAVVCRKEATDRSWPSRRAALAAARQKLSRLEEAGLILSVNDRRTVFFGQLLTTIGAADELADFAAAVENELQGSIPKSLESSSSAETGVRRRRLPQEPVQQSLLDE